MQYNDDLVKIIEKSPSYEFQMQHDSFHMPMSSPKTQTMLCSTQDQAPTNIQKLRNEIALKNISYNNALSKKADNLLTQFNSRSNLDAVFTNKGGSPSSDTTSQIRSNLQHNQSKKLLQQQKVYDNPLEQKSESNIITKEKFTKQNKYSKEGLNLMSVEEYILSQKKSDIDMAFMTTSGLGEKSPEITRRSSAKHVGGQHRKNLSVLSYHNILKDVPKEIGGFGSKKVTSRQSYNFSGINRQDSGVSPFRHKSKMSELMLPAVDRTSPHLSVQQESTFHKNSTSSIGDRIDYKNMKVLSIKEFHEINKDRKDDRKNMKMHQYLKRDSQERLGTKSIIEQNVYHPNRSMILDESQYTSQILNNHSFLQDGNISILSNASRARVKLNQMQQLRSSDSQEMIEYKKQLTYFKKASLFDINDGLSKQKRKTYQALAASAVSMNEAPLKKMEEKYPKLLNELNDSSSVIPAYQRFQENSVLRDDLKDLKAQFFKSNYHQHLNIPREYLEKVQYHGENIDANKYFQLKYFLNEKDKMDVLKQMMNEGESVNKILPKTQSYLNQQKKNFEFMDQFRKADIDKGQSLLQVDIENQYQNGKFVEDDIVQENMRNQVIKEKERSPLPLTRSERASVLSLGAKNKYLSQNKDYKRFLQKSLETFKRDTNSRIGSLVGLKVPKILQNAIENSEKQKKMKEQIINKNNKLEQLNHRSLRNQYRSSKAIKHLSGSLNIQTFQSIADFEERNKSVFESNQILFKMRKKGSEPDSVHMASNERNSNFQRGETNISFNVESQGDFHSQYGEEKQGTFPKVKGATTYQQIPDRGLMST